MRFHGYTVVAMPRASRLTPTPIPRGDESLGERLARLRKERGFTQKELASKTGLILALISDYERGKLRLNAEMILRFTTALEISTDELLQPGGPSLPASPAAKCCAAWSRSRPCRRLSRPCC